MAPAPKYSLQQQEEKILTAAAQCVEESSLMDFTMSSIASRAGLSMGSIYKHIQSKEDVLIALATNMFKNLRQVFERLLALPLSMPEKLLGIGLMTPDKYQLYSFDSHLEMLIGNEALLKRASNGWIEKMVRVEEPLEQLFRDAISAAVDSGELALDGQNRKTLVEEILVAIWSMNVGFFQVAFQRHARAMVGEPADLPFPLAITDPFTKTVQRLLNTYQWQQPLTDAGIKNLCGVLEQEGLR
ncbi:MAG: TetR/AcrR family transcriptional regulator [Pseudomonadales bacterium]